MGVFDFGFIIFSQMLTDDCLTYIFNQLASDPSE